MKALHIIVSGKVHGVSFRAFARECALRHKINGTVRNLPTNEVEIIAEGDEQNIEQFISEIKLGSPGSSVAKIRTLDIGMQSFADFKVLK